MHDTQLSMHHHMCRPMHSRGCISQASSASFTQSLKRLALEVHPQHQEKGGWSEPGLKQR